jgi:hypothetical protein
MLAGLFGLYVVLAAGSDSPRTLVAVAGLAVCALTAGALRSGWMIPSGLIGTLFGLSRFPVAHDANIYANTFNWAVTVAVSALMGLILGLFVDIIRFTAGYSRATDENDFD